MHFSSLNPPFIKSVDTELQMQRNNYIFLLLLQRQSNASWKSFLLSFNPLLTSLFHLFYFFASDYRVDQVRRIQGQGKVGKIIVS